MKTKLIAGFLAVLIIILLYLLMRNTKWSIETSRVESMNKASDIKHPQADGGHTKQLLRKNRRSRRFPNAIIIGVKKGGTRALIEMLSSHPSIKISKKEVNYFSKEYDQGLKWYLNQMPLATESDIVLEKSPSYFTFSAAVKRIYEKSKFLIY